MEPKHHIRWEHALDWLCAVFTCALLGFTIISGRNAARPVSWAPVQPELLFIVVLLAGSGFREKFPRRWRPFSYIGIALVLAGFTLWMVEINWGKWPLCAGMGLLIATVLPALWAKYRGRNFFLYLASAMVAGVFIMSAAAIPRPPWELVLLLGLTLTMGLFFGLAFLPVFADNGQVAPPPPIPALPSKIQRWQLYLLILVALSIPSMFTEAAYDWFFPRQTLITTISMLALCGGVLVAGFSASRLQLAPVLMLWVGCEVALKIILLLIRNNTLFAHDISVFSMGLILAAFICLPMMIWPEALCSFRVCSGLAVGILIMFVIPRTVTLFLPESWLFTTKVGWTVQGIALLYQFLLFCLFGYYLLIGRPPLGETKPPTPAPTQAHTLPGTLTEREKEIAQLLLEGKNRKQIAAQLNIAENTVKTHMRNLFDKTGCHSKVQFITHFLG